MRSERPEACRVAQGSKVEFGGGHGYCRTQAAPKLFHLRAYALKASVPIFKPSGQVYVYFSGTTSISCSFNKYTSTGSYYMKSMVLDTQTPAAKRMRAAFGSDELTDTCVNT